jgi:hypothetical protein
MPGSAHYNQLAFYQEAAQGESPAEAGTDWETEAAAPPSAFRVAPIVGTVTVNSIGAGLINDERAYDDIMDDEVDRVGIDNPEFAFECYMEANPAAPADGVQITTHWQSVLAQHIMGGLSRSTTRTADTAAGNLHTTTTVEVDDDSGIAVGDHVAITLQNYTGLGGATVGHPRRVVAINSATNLITVDQALPVAPVDGDIVGGACTSYVDATVLEDSSVGPTTLSWHLAREREGGDANWEVFGSKTQLNSITCERDDSARWALSVFGGSSLLPHQSANPDWTTDPENEVPFQIGRHTQLWLQDYGTTTSTSANGLWATNVFTVEDMGIPVVPADAITSISEGMQGRAGYSTTRGDTTVSVSTHNHDPGWYADYLARTWKVARFYNLAPRGSGFAITLPRCQINERPDFVDDSGAAVNALSLKAFRDLSSVATTQLARSKICLVWY